MVHPRGWRYGNPKVKAASRFRRRHRLAHEEHQERPVVVKHGDRGGILALGNPVTAGGFTKGCDDSAGAFLQAVVICAHHQLHGVIASGDDHNNPRELGRCQEVTYIADGHRHHCIGADIPLSGNGEDDFLAFLSQATAVGGGYG